MSSVASIFNVPSIQSELDVWSFAHAVHHHDINRTIYLQTGITLAEYVLDPFDPNNAEVWLYQHQLMHQAQDQILLIDGFDLLDVDLKDRNELAGWVWLNASEHLQAANLLGIG
jgi:hypothetical protein